MKSDLAWRILGGTLAALLLSAALLLTGPVRNCRCCVEGTCSNWFCYASGCWLQ